MDTREAVWFYACGVKPNDSPKVFPAQNAAYINLEIFRAKRGVYKLEISAFIAAE